MLSANNMQKYFKIQFLCLHIARFENVPCVPRVEFSTGTCQLSFYSYTRSSYSQMSSSSDFSSRASLLVHDCEDVSIYLDTFDEGLISFSLDKIISYLLSALNESGHALSSNDEKQLSLLLEAS